MRQRLARITRSTLVLFTLVVGVAGCHRAFVAPRLPSTARRFAAPSIYRKWWAMTAECSRSPQQSMESVEWFVVPGVSVFWYQGNLTSGFWSGAGNRIVLAEGALDDGAVVRHEMLHALQPIAGHSRAFVGQCGGLVICLSACREAAGKAPVVLQALRRVDADAMLVDVAFDPPDEGSATDDHLTFTVTAHNPSADSVVVDLASRTTAFRFELTSATDTIRNAVPAWESSGMVFAPGETRRAVFDFRTASVLGGLRASEGTFAVRGGFGARWSAPKSITVSHER
ncbi:MAG TPA: hypothetical protein VNM36_17000 [Gemmatimonadaceae bacterium]|nr:hypothetical protein [Gemmatimonadaceae bacterium]